MGATNQIKGTNISLQLNDKNCPQCQQPFTEKDLDNENYDIWFDTSNDVRLIAMENLKNDSYYKPFGRTGYELTIWIRSIEHEYCPTVMKCERCYGKFLEKEMKADDEWGMNYYCLPCYQQIKKEN